MPVYIDNYNASYQRMIMCHMIADTEEELHAMAKKIGIARKWHQAPPEHKYSHYDICLSKKKQALRLGAIEVSTRRLILIARKTNNRLRKCGD